MATLQEINRLNDHLKRAFEGEAWHGPALLSLLADVTAAQAAARPLAAAHSIWELVLHIAAWERAARHALAGQPIHVTDDENFPAVTDTGEAAWQETLATLQYEHQLLQSAVARLTDADLDASVPGGSYTFYYLLHGVVQHDLYHAGQIALLKKGYPA